MRRFRAAFACGLLALAACATSTDPVAVRAALQQRYDAYHAALAGRDGNALSGILAPDFKGYSVDGQPADAGLVIQTTTSLPRDANMKSSTRIETLRVEGNEAIVDVRTDLTSVKKERGSP